MVEVRVSCPLCSEKCVMPTEGEFGAEYDTPEFSRIIKRLLVPFQRVLTRQCQYDQTLHHFGRGDA